MVNVNRNGEVGDAHILVNGDAVTMIDAGEYAQAKALLLPYLERNGIKSIDHFFVSHPHTDHYAGIDALLEGGIDIRNVYYNMPPEGVADFAFIPDAFRATLGRAEARGAKLHDIGTGFKLSFSDGTEIKVLYAHKTRQLDGRKLSVNDYSLLLRWDTEGFRVLFAGDLNYQLGSYLAQYDYFKADILKVPHHGVTGLAPNIFFETVNPQLNMFPTPWILWTDPRIEQLKDWTMSKKIHYCVTGLNGDVVLTFKDSTLILQPEINTAACPAGRSAIVPGLHINKPVVLPQMLLLRSAQR